MVVLYRKLLLELRRSDFINKMAKFSERIKIEFWLTYMASHFFMSGKLLLLDFHLFIYVYVWILIRGLIIILSSFG